VLLLAFPAEESAGNAGAKDPEAVITTIATMAMTFLMINPFIVFFEKTFLHGLLCPF
jgi:hypothetical protein